MGDKKQVKFWAEPDVHEWLHKQPNMTHALNELIRRSMRGSDSTEKRIASLENKIEALVSADSAYREVMKIVTPKVWEQVLSEVSHQVGKLDTKQSGKRKP